MFSPCTGKKGANASNHNVALDHLIGVYKLKYPNQTIRIRMSTDGCRGQYAGVKNFAKLASFLSRHDGVEITQTVATKYGGKGVWDGLGKVFKRSVTDTITGIKQEHREDGDFNPNLAVQVGCLAAMKSPAPLKAPYGPRAEINTSTCKTPYDQKKPNAADTFNYVYLAPTEVKKAEAEKVRKEWRAQYTKEGRNEFKLDIILAVDDTREYKTIKNSSKHYFFIGGGDNETTLQMLRRQCGCKPCHGSEFTDCKRKDVRGKLKTVKITRKKATSSAVLKIKEDQEEWVESWRRGDILACMRERGDMTDQQMHDRSYVLTRVLNKAKKAPKKGIKVGGGLIKCMERIYPGQWYVTCQDLEMVDEGERKWKFNKQSQKYVVPWRRFTETEDIEMEVDDFEYDDTESVLSDHSHRVLTDLWTRQLNES